MRRIVINIEPDYIESAKVNLDKGIVAVSNGILIGFVAKAKNGGFYVHTTASDRGAADLGRFNFNEFLKDQELVGTKLYQL